MKRFSISFTGRSPLIMHQDSIEWSDRMEVWKKAAKSEGRVSKAGDDRTPAYRWIGCLWNNGSHVVVPAAAMIACLRDTGKMFSDTTRGKGATLKRGAVTGIAFDDSDFELATNGKLIDFSEIVSTLGGVEDFEVHRTRAREMGFELDMRRVKIQSSKHIRVRPRFDNWALETQCTVMHDQLENENELSRLLNIAGAQVGIGDWRPSSGSPGTFGRFTAEVQEID